MLFLGADHRGYELKEKLKNYFNDNNIEYDDCGTYSTERADYPLIVENIFSKMNIQKDKAIIICGSGIGMAMAANKFKGVRAGLCLSAEIAKEAKEHNDINVLALAADYTNLENAISIINTWTSTKALDGRYLDRRNMINEIEYRNMK